MPRSWPRQRQSVSAFRAGDGGRHGTPRRRDGHYLRLWNAAGDCLVVATVGGHTTNSPLGNTGSVWASVHFAPTAMGRIRTRAVMQAGAAKCDTWGAMRNTAREKQEYGRKVCGVFSVQEAAVALNKPRRTLYRWEAAGKMPPRVAIRAIGGKRKYYRRADILAMVEADLRELELSISPPDERGPE